MKPTRNDWSPKERKPKCWDDLFPKPKPRLRRNYIQNGDFMSDDASRKAFYIPAPPNAFGLGPQLRDAMLHTVEAMEGGWFRHTFTAPAVELGFSIRGAEAVSGIIRDGKIHVSGRVGGSGFVQISAGAELAHEIAGSLRVEQAGSK